MFMVVQYTFYISKAQKGMPAFTKGMRWGKGGQF